MTRCILTIKRILREKGITQKQLAQAIGMTEVGVYKMLQVENPKLKTLIQIAKALDVDVWELFVGCPSLDGFFGVVKMGNKQIAFSNLDDMRDFLDEEERGRRE